MKLGEAIRTAVHPCMSLGLTGHSSYLERLDDGLMTLTSRSFGSSCSFKFRLNLLLSIDMAFSNSDSANFPSVTCVTSAADLPKIGRRLRAKGALRGRTSFWSASTSTWKSSSRLFARNEVTC
jgi:hypothetical protein